MQTVSANGAHIPALGFGTFRMPGPDVLRIVPQAIKLGFRHIDTAQIYRNEAEVGEAIEASGVGRSDIFLTTKVWVDHYKHADFLASVDESLKKLRTDYVDLLLLHWPSSGVPLAEQIGALNDVKTAGKVKNIGVSNFNTALMAQSVALSQAPIATNQIEYHPYLDQTKVLDAARATGMSITAYYAHGRWQGAERAASEGYRHQARQDRSPGRVALAHPAKGRDHAVENRDGKPADGKFRHFRFRSVQRRDGLNPQACPPQRPHRQPRWPGAGLGPGGSIIH